MTSRTPPLNIQRYREQRELTLTELAAKSGVSLPYLWQLEAGTRTNPRLPILRAIADALDITVTDLTNQSAA